jgi:hypothetical protein
MSKTTIITNSGGERINLADEEATRIHAEGVQAKAELEARRAAQDVIRRAMNDRYARERDVKWLRSRIGAGDDPWIQDQIAKLDEKKVRG